MVNNIKIKEFFGVGPIGGLFSLLCWIVAIYAETRFNVPKMAIAPLIRTALLAIFIFDIVYLIIGSNFQLNKHGRGKTLITSGPYQFIRHPLYSLWIYSFTGIISMLMRSWLVIITVIPISLFWSWIVTYEENHLINKFGNKYRDYIENTGQFLPSWKALKSNIEE